MLLPEKLAIDVKSPKLGDIIGDLDYGSFLNIFPKNLKKKKDLRTYHKQ